MMDDAFGGDFNNTQVATGSSNDNKPEGFAPVFLKQVKQSMEGGFKLFGMSFGMIHIVAIVRSIDTSSTKITYSLEDHTGRIEGHLWIGDGDELKVAKVVPNTYVKVYGTVRSMGDTRSIMIINLQPIIDPNEIVTHALEVLNTRYLSEKFDKQLNSDMDYGSTSSSAAQIQSYSGLETKYAIVLEAITNHGSPEGISRKEIEKKFPQYSMNQMKEILDFMIFEGHIYSSIDPDHFLSTGQL